MDNLKKYTIIIIRLQAMGFVLVGLIHWILILGMIVIASIRSVWGTADSYAAYLIVGIAYLFVGIIVYARSRSLADYFIRAVEND